MALSDGVVNTLLMVAAPIPLFYGKKLFKPFLYLMSFFFGVFCATYVFNVIISAGVNVAQGTILGTQIAVGVVFAILAVKFFYLGVFILGGVSGITVVNIIFNIISQSASFSSTSNLKVVHGVMMILGFLFGGYFAKFLLEGILVPAVTSIFGGHMFVAGLNYWLYTSDVLKYDTFGSSQFYSNNVERMICPENGCYALVAVWIILSVSGFFVQTRLIKYDSDDKVYNHKGRFEEA